MSGYALFRDRGQPGKVFRVYREAPWKYIGKVWLAEDGTWSGSSFDDATTTDYRAWSSKNKVAKALLRDNRC